MQSSYGLLVVKLFNKVVCLDNFHCSMPVLWEWVGVEWLKTPLGWCETATPELQTPSARVAPAGSLLAEMFVLPSLHESLSVSGESLVALGWFPQDFGEIIEDIN